MYGAQEGMPVGTPRRRRLTCWAWWVFASAVGVPFASLWGCLHTVSPDLRPVETVLAPFLYGGLAAVPQAITLGVWQRSGWWWVWLPLTAFGSVIGLWLGIAASLGLVVSGVASDAGGALWVAIGVCTGLAVGALQSVALRRANGWAFGWTLTSSVGGVLMAPTLLQFIPPCESPWRLAGLAILAAAVYGGLTGTVLAWRLMPRTIAS